MRLAIVLALCACGRINFDEDLGPPITGCPGLTVAVGKEHACAVRADGTLACWGGNLYGQLGDGSQTFRLAPIEVVLPGAVKQVRAGCCSSRRHVLRRPDCSVPVTCAVATGTGVAEAARVPRPSWPQLF